MHHQPSRGGLALAALRLGLAVPFLYYGVQVAAAPFYPGFSFAGTTASELGSDRSERPTVFNTGVMVLGAVTLAAAVGFLLALRRLGVHPALAWLTAAAVAVNGVQTLWAGIFPMPDPRHGGHPVFVVGMLLLPVLLTAVVWRRTRSPALRVYFVATLVLLAAMVPVMSGASGLDTHAYRGLVQRVFTLAIFPPIGVAAFVLARRVGELPR
jgi:hypothetical membrane protein